MIMHTEKYCDNLERLDPVAAIRAIHQAWLQMRALPQTGHYDNGPAIEALRACLAQAGHPAGGAI